MFRAPLGAALFAVEVLYSDPDFESEALIPAIISSIVSYVVVASFTGWNAIFETADKDLAFAIDNTPDPDAGVSIDGNRHVDIQPAANWYGSTEVRIKVTDLGGLSDTDTFRVTVHSVNDAPVATDNDFVVQEDSADNLLYPLVDDTDVEGDSLTIARTTQPRSGTVKVVAANTALAYTPDPDFISGTAPDYLENGPDTFDYQVNDGRGNTRTGTVYITGMDGAKQGHLYAFGQDGSPQWNVVYGPELDKTGPAPGGTRGTPTIDGDRIFLMSGFAKLVVLNKADGKVLKTIDLLERFGAGQANLF